MRTKIAIKSDKFTPFGGIFYVLDQFDRFVGRSRVDTELGLRRAFYGYQYSEIFRALYTQKVVTCALKHAEFIYIRAERCASLYEKVKKRTDGEYTYRCILMIRCLL